MTLPSTDRQAVDTLQNHFLSKFLPGIGAWGELALLRGWKDDFLGDAFRDEYDLRTVGAASSVLLQNNAHGGVARLQTDANIGDYARIMLGDSAYNFNTLDADEGWMMIGRYKLSHTTSILVDMFVTDALVNRIHVTADTSHGANWYLRTDNNSGLDNWADSGIAIDTAWHTHRLRATSGRVEHWMDGTLINYTTTKVPTVVETGNVRCLARANAARYMDIDYWTVIPV